MKTDGRTPFTAVLAAELTMIVVIGGAGYWFGQDVVVRALKLVIGDMIG